MLAWILPQSDDFFRLFKDAAAELVCTARAFRDLIAHPTELRKYAQIIAHHEQEADRITLKTFEMLHKTFITPIDRNEIHQLSHQLEEVVDYINRAAQRIASYHLTQPPSEFGELAQAIILLAELIQKAVGLLENLDNTPEIIKLCHEIYSVEDQSDQLILSGMAALFQMNIDYKQFYKIKDIFDYMKGVLSHSQSVATVLHSIVLEYS